MKTECPHCHTIFAITEEQLELADGMVRCGVCDEVFSALVQDDLFVETAEETETFVADEYHEAISTDAEPVDTGISTAPDTPDEPAGITDTDRVDDAAGLFEGSADFVVPDNIRYQDQHHTMLATVMWSLGSIVLLLVLASQVAWVQRDSIMQSGFFRPFIDELCSRVDCSQLSVRAPDRMEMTSRNVYTHPTVEDALMLSLTLVNRASFAQGYPDIRIHFSDRVGTVIAARQLHPREYLSLPPEDIRPLLPDEPVSFGIEIRDPGTKALTYEFEFL